MRVKTSELLGAKLDWAVAKADGEYPKFKLLQTVGGTPMVSVRVDGRVGREVFSPSTDWSQCGPLIECHHLTIESDMDSEWVASCVTESREGHPGWVRGVGPSLLIAACRAIVAAKLGDEVDVPEGL